ncbi:hypothetical protein HG717_16360 [Rhodococcus erythropolis]|uniref:hypothetical protein n=1 Tax=Rhodococcus erythropolis TaxID=1833 RepID=UPI001C9A62BC|nr:hypothetical protein [Rhodococcus erythropolis]MBY6385473.1 hypothetical protein [Rhodococcus erythropolis]
MPKFRKKPVEIEARQWDGTETGAVPIVEWVSENGGDAAHQRLAVSGSRHNTRYDERIYISTLEGPINASPNDWIIRGIQGEFYPCKPDIFAATYEAI